MRAVADDAIEIDSNYVTLGDYIPTSEVDSASRVTNLRHIEDKATRHNQGHLIDHSMFTNSQRIFSRSVYDIVLDRR